MTITKPAQTGRKRSPHRLLGLLMGLAMSAAVVAPGAVVTAPPAMAADQPAPQVLAMKRVSPESVAPGSSVQISFTLAQRAQRVVFVYTDESLATEKRLEWTGTPAAGPLTATATTPVTADSFSHGLHKLQSVVIYYDSSSLAYYRNSTNQPTLPVSWESLDFTVNNPAKVLVPNANLVPPGLGMRKESGYSYALVAVDHGTWTAPPSSYSYEWFRDGVRQNSEGEDFFVSGSYAGTGSGLTLKLTAMAPGRLPETVETAPFYFVDATEPVLAPNISVRTPTKAVFDPATIKGLPAGAKPSVSYQWLVDRVKPIAGATGDTYVPKPYEAGKQLGVAAVVSYRGRVVGTFRSASDPSVKMQSLLRDFDGDSRPDVITRKPNGTLTLFSGAPGGFSSGSKDIGWGWAGFTSLSSPGDFDGDGFMDVLARDASGQLWLYRGNGRGGWLGSSVIGTGWGVFSEIIPASDFNGDGTSDILARDAQGRLFLYPGNGRGGWLPASQVGQGWNIFNKVFTPGDFSGDGVSDILARGTDGQLNAYYPDGKGGWSSSRVLKGNYASNRFMGPMGGLNSTEMYNYFFAVTDQGEFRVEQMSHEGYYYRQSYQIGTGWGYLTAVF
ncbi:VCBS repeat-containing protein [Paenarthrobacter ilicis]|uniref:FG-GAP repeat domain-containing protein n=1 Tax=Paenarthrobacter ilicis TaxID=43665 RepID=UPI0028D27D92|nr:VCBS repeat-containing protein [Paenarthrobacter ilicis]